MNNRKKVVSLLVVLVTVALVLSGCGQKKPPHYGTFLKDGRDLVELGELRLYSLPGANELEGVPVADESQPVVVHWHEGTRLQYLQFFSINNRKELTYSADPKDDGVLELRPKDPLDKGYYCYIQGDPMGMGLPGWCFEIK